METEIGKISHFFSKIGVAVVELTGNLKVGDTIRIKGSTTDFTQEVESMQVDHNSVQEAKSGDSIGLKMKEKVRENDKVYKIEKTEGNA